MKDVKKVIFKAIFKTCPNSDFFFKLTDSIAKTKKSSLHYNLLIGRMRIDGFMPFSITLVQNETQSALGSLILFPATITVTLSLCKCRSVRFAKCCFPTVVRWRHGTHNNHQFSSSGKHLACHLGYLFNCPTHHLFSVYPVSTPISHIWIFFCLPSPAGPYQLPCLKPEWKDTLANWGSFHLKPELWGSAERNFSLKLVT